jgi:hypothetical protein
LTTFSEINFFLLLLLKDWNSSGSSKFLIFILLYEINDNSDVFLIFFPENLKKKKLQKKYILYIRNE